VGNTSQMGRTITFILLLLFIQFSGFSANENFKFKRISTTEGLSNSWVRCFFQDDFGFIWIGTADGLNRFDGINVKVYRPWASINSSLGDITINDIIKKDDKNFWVATDIGLFQFNIATEDFSLDTLLSSNPILAIECDRSGDFWFGTNHGLYRYSTTTKKKETFNYDENDNQSLSNDYINTITTDSRNNIWIGTKGGLNLFNPMLNNFTRFVKNNNAGSISGNDILSICEDINHQIWVGTALNGLNILHSLAGNYKFTQIADGTISSLLSDNRFLWIGSASGEGIRLLDLNSFSTGKLKIDTLKNDPLVKTSIADNSTFCFFSDKHNDIWIGTYGNGTNFFSHRSKPFHNILKRFDSKSSIQNNLVNAFFEEKDYLWIGTEAGLDRLNKKTGKFDHFKYETNNPKSLGSNQIYAICKDSRGNLWVGNWAGGLNRFDYRTNTFKRYLPDGKPGSIGSANVFSICEDSFNNLWIGTTSGGLNRFNYDTETFTIYKRDPNNKSSLSGRSMNCILQTKSGDLYISLFNNIDKYNFDSDDFEHIDRNTLETNAYQRGNVITMFEDSKNNLWFGTNAGLELYNHADKTVKIFSTNNGLPDNTIQAILEDNYGNLWLSTNNGISKFIDGINIPSKPVFQNFSTSDGLPANDFKRRSAYKNEAGYMYFGSSNGYTYFHPDSIVLSPQEPELVFTSFQILENSSNESSRFKSLTANINLTKSIELQYPNTNFIVGFASLNYLNSHKNKYRYKLEGYDSEWIDAGDAMSATYTNIIEGQFTFKVIGTNNDGVWQEKPIQLKIRIYPPWWKSNLFKLLIFVSFIITGIIIIIIRFSLLNQENKVLEAKVDKRTTELTRLNNLLEEKQAKITAQNIELERHRNQLEELVVERTSQLITARAKAEESDHLKSAFLANMSHEIRTPLNAIIGFSSMLNDKYATPEKREKYIEHIRNNGKMLTVLINDIIDISLIEANQMKLSNGKFNVDTVLNELSQLYLLEKNTQIQLKLTKSEQGADLFIFNDVIRFRQIMVNLLTNAFKYTDRGTIEYGYNIMENSVLFFVSDTGIGIEKEELTKIFDHFYKTKKEKSKLYRGTGIGLAICKKLVEQMGGKIWVESKIKVGSTFYFTLPLIIS